MALTAAARWLVNIRTKGSFIPHDEYAPGVGTADKAASVRTRSFAL